MADLENPPLVNESKEEKMELLPNEVEVKEPDQKEVSEERRRNLSTGRPYKHDNALNIPQESYDKIPEDLRRKLEQVDQKLGYLSDEVKKESRRDRSCWPCCNYLNKIITQSEEVIRKLENLQQEFLEKKMDLSDDDKRIIHDGFKTSLATMKKAVSELQRAKMYHNKSRWSNFCMNLGQVASGTGLGLLIIVGIFLALCLLVMIPKLSWYVLFKL